MFIRTVSAPESILKNGFPNKEVEDLGEYPIFFVSEEVLWYSCFDINAGNFRDLLSDMDCAVLLVFDFCLVP